MDLPKVYMWDIIYLVSAFGTLYGEGGSSLLFQVDLLILEQSFRFILIILCIYHII